jgi:hypothetical protein
MNKTPLFILSLVVTLQAIANLVRFLWDIPVMIGSFPLPGWTGALFFVFLGLLAAWAFRALYSNQVNP